MIRVAVAEEHGLFRLAITRLLREVRGVVVAGDARDGVEAVDLALKKYPDVMLMNLGLPKKDGIDATRDILAQTKTKILVFAAADAEDYILRALRAGAHGCVSKDATLEDLSDAIETVSRGGRYLPPHIARSLAEQFLAPRRSSVVEGLSDREFQVLTLLAGGSTTHQVAEKLHLSGKTISSHRARVLQKLQLRNNADLTRFAVRNGLIEA